MKIILGLLVAVFLASSAGAAELPFRFDVLDVNVPTSPGVGLEDVDANGVILGASYVDIDGDGVYKLVGILSNKGTNTIFRCPSTLKAGYDPASVWIATEGFSINAGQVVGYCNVGDDSGVSKVHGFIRGSTGKMNIFNYPGAEGTMLQGISGRYVTGIFWLPGDPVLHCLLFDRNTREFTQIDFPGAVNSSCYGVTEARRVLGAFVMSPTERGYFVWDNGQIEVILGDNDGIAVVEFNRNEASIGLMNDPNFDPIYGVGNGFKLFFCDDGHCSDIPGPEGWNIYDIGGVNDKGWAVGRVEIILDGISHGNHGFLMRPERGALAGLR